MYEVKMYEKSSQAREAVKIANQSQDSDNRSIANSKQQIT